MLFTGKPVQINQSRNWHQLVPIIFFSQPAQLEELLLSPSFFSLVCRVGHRRPWDGVLLASLAAVADDGDDDDN